MSADFDAALMLGVLGPTAAWRDGREAPLGSPQQAALLTLLVLHRDEPVTTDRMLDVLWPAGSPASAVQVLRTYVSRLRAGPLGAPGAPVLVTGRGGYELRTARGQVDADRFESLIAGGRRRLDDGAAAEAEALLLEALALMRGLPLADLPDDERARLERDRLLELRDAANEDLVEAQLAQGRHRELVPALRAAVRSSPLSERSWAQLMVALYRSGRQAAALDVYRDGHRALDALGLVPGPWLRALERMVLIHDPALDLPARPTGGVPRYETSFLGRERDRAARGTLDAGFTLVDLARVTQAQGRSEVTIEHAGQALADFRRREDPRGVASALLLLGRGHVSLGDEERGRALLHDALALARRWGYAVIVQEAELALEARGYAPSFTAAKPSPKRSPARRRRTDGSCR